MDLPDLQGKERTDRTANRDLRESKDHQAPRDHQGKEETQDPKEREARPERARSDHQVLREIMENQDKWD